MIDLMILYVLINHDYTMYAIHKRIEEYFIAYTTPSFGALKPSLVRLEKKGCITSSKIMSAGGKLSVFYSITKEGLQELKRLLLAPFSKNPLQFLSDAKVKLSCLFYLDDDKEAKLSIYNEIKTNALIHKRNAESVLNNEYTPLTSYQRIVLDSTVCEFNNFIILVESMEKDARNS